jgi:hypothetical protein
VLKARRPRLSARHHHSGRREGSLTLAVGRCSAVSGSPAQSSGDSKSTRSVARVVTDHTRRSREQPNSPCS